MSGYLLAALLLAAAGGFAAAMIARRGRRCAALSAAAEQLGLSFNARDHLELPRRFRFFEIFSSGYHCFASNVLHGHVDGLDVRIFRYFRQLGNGKDSRFQSLAVLVGELPVALPRLMITARRPATVFGAPPGMHRVEPDSAECGRRFELFAPDAATVRRLLRQSSLCELLADSDVLGLELAGKQLVLWMAGPWRQQHLLQALQIWRRIAHEPADADAA